MNDLLVIDNEKEMLERALDILPKAVARHILDVPLEYFQISEEELKIKAHVTTTDNLLRMNFWRACSEHAQGKKDLITAADIYNNACLKQNFYSYYLKNKYKVAWMLRPPPGAVAIMESVLEKSFLKLEEAIEKSNLIFPNGHMDSRAAAVVLKAMEFSYNRLHGPMVQKHEIQQQNINTNINVSSKDAEKFLNRLDEIKNRIETRDVRPILPNTAKDPEE
jgi:hypothetical protein